MQDNDLLVVRADANAEIGLGHVMRTLALAQAWIQQGGRVVYLCCCEGERVRERIRAAGAEFVPLDRPYPDPADLEAVNALLVQYPVSWLVLDGYQFDLNYQRAIGGTGVRLLVLDDIAHLPRYHADVLLNQNLDAEKLDYHCDPKTRRLLGVRYVLLRPEFLNHSHHECEIYGRAQRILVTLGGSDPSNTTLKVLRSLDALRANSEVRVVIGPANPHGDALREMVAHLPCKIRLLQAVGDMPSLMAWADLAVSAGGSTCWELAYMGVPMVVLVVADNQVGIAAGLADRGAAINMGWCERVSIDGIRSILETLVSGRTLREEMSQCGRALIDGSGCNRVVSVLREPGWYKESSRNAYPVYGK